MGEQVPNVKTMCRDCGGLAYAERDILGSAYRRDGHGRVMWRHLRESDWVDSPHNVIPEDVDLARVEAAEFDKDYPRGRAHGYHDGSDPARPGTHLRDHRPNVWAAQTTAWRQGYEAGWMEAQ